MRKNKKDIKLQTDPDPRDNRHRRKVTHRPWRIECRRIKSEISTFMNAWIEEMYGEDAWEWHDYWNTYETKKSRDEAMRNLIKKVNSDARHSRYEYRIPLDEIKY